MVIVPRVDVTAQDIRSEGRDPDKWSYTAKSNGYFEVRKGVLGVGELIFEDHAALLVKALNESGAD